MKVYTRDSANWLALSYAAQCLFLQLLRKADRAGLIELGGAGRRAVAIVLGQAAIWDQLEPALAELEASGVVAVRGTALVIPNFLEAQEARQSDRQRQAEHRARRREIANSQVAEIVNADCHTVSQAVTPSHTPSQPVTPRLDQTRLEKEDLVPVGTGTRGGSGEVPNPGQAILTLVAPPKPSFRDEATEWVEWFNRKFGRRFQVGGELLEAFTRLRRAGYSPRDMRAVALFQREQWATNDDMAKFLRPETLLRLSNFKRYVVGAREWFAQEGQADALR